MKPSYMSKCETINTNKKKYPNNRFMKNYQHKKGTDSNKQQPLN